MSPWSQEAHDARLARGNSTLDRWNVESVIARIEEYPEIVEAAVASAAAENAELRSRVEALAEQWESIHKTIAPVPGEPPQGQVIQYAKQLRAILDAPVLAPAHDDGSE